MEGLDGWKMIFSNFKKVILQVNHIWNMTSLEFSPETLRSEGGLELGEERCSFTKKTEFLIFP